MQEWNARGSSSSSKLDFLSMTCYRLTNCNQLLSKSSTAETPQCASHGSRLRQLKQELLVLYFQVIYKVFSSHFVDNQLKQAAIGRSVLKTK